MSVLIRDAARGDVPVILDFIRALAVYERLADEAVATEADLERELFGPWPKVFCQLAIVNGMPAGFALWYYTFSTFQGRHGIWLEDLFVNPEMRGQGIGKALLIDLAQRCVREELGRYEWNVLNWNQPSIDFYVNNGAVFLDDWRRCRVSGAALEKLGGGIVTVAVAIIAAIAENGVIGQGNHIPWRLPGDFAHFKRMTMGKPLIMGRKTFESIGRPLPGRTNIVVTRQEGYQPDGVIVISSLEAALEHAQEIAKADRANEVMIGGGAEIYRQALPLADRMYLTQVSLEPEGDTYFPPIDFGQWKPGGEINVAPHPEDTASFRVRVYRRNPLARR